MSTVLVLLAISWLLHDVRSFPFDKRTGLFEEDEEAEKGSIYKILNGQPAKPGVYPFAVSLQIDGSHFCGGSVISKFWVVSAAHCFTIPNMEKLVKARVGSLDFNSGGSLHDVADIIVHSKFNEPTVFNNDIALVKVKTPFPLGSDVKTVRLAGPDLVEEDGDTLFTAGWGITGPEEDVVPSPVLLETSFRVVDRKICSRLPGIKRMVRDIEALKITKNMICARAPQTDTMHGDSGGPLLRREEGDFVLVGIVSWGEGEGKMDSPGVYTNVANYNKWIQKHAKLDE